VRCGAALGASVRGAVHATPTASVLVNSGNLGYRFITES
jgi:hypothetical protein